MSAGEGAGGEVDREKSKCPSSLYDISLAKVICFHVRLQNQGDFARENNIPPFVVIISPFVIPLYKIKMMKDYELPDDAITYDSVSEKDVLYLIHAARKGIGYPWFASMAKAFPFSMSDWSGFLHISERTLQRYAKEMKAFDAVSSERIIEITLLYKEGVEVFGNKKKFDAWLNIQNVALGGARPKELLDSNLGLLLIRNELVKIEHGVLA